MRFTEFQVMKLINGEQKQAWDNILTHFWEFYFKVYKELLALRKDEAFDNRGPYLSQTFGSVFAFIR